MSSFGLVLITQGLLVFCIGLILGNFGETTRDEWILRLGICIPSALITFIGVLLILGVVE